MNRRTAIVTVLIVVQLVIVGAMFRSFDSIGALFSPKVAEAAVSDRVMKTLDVDGAAHVAIDDDTADITIAVGPDARVAVDEETTQRGASDDRTPLVIQKTPDGVRIARAASHNHFHFQFHFGRVERALRVTVPINSRIDVLSARNIAVAGLQSTVSLHSDNGKIAVRDHRGDIEATSDNGMIDLRDVAASNITASADNGRIVLTNVHTKALSVSSDNGRIEASRTLATSGKVESSNGRVELGFDRGADLTVTATTSSGKVHATAPLSAIAPDGADDDHPRTVKIGNGSGQLEVTSDNGSIYISSTGA